MKERAIHIKANDENELDLKVTQIEQHITAELSRTYNTEKSMLAVPILGMMKRGVELHNAIITAELTADEYETIMDKFITR